MIVINFIDPQLTLIEYELKRARPCPNKGKFNTTQAPRAPRDTSPTTKQFLREIFGHHKVEASKVCKVTYTYKSITVLKSSLNLITNFLGKKVENNTSRIERTIEDYKGHSRNS